MSMGVRAAREADAAQMSDVLTRSIAELCEADHRRDQGILDAWLSNKTPDAVCALIADPSRHVMVAVDGDRVACVGATGPGGRIELLYVAPDYRFRGVSKLMLAALEQHLRTRGVREIKLTSSNTALRFYLAAGYERDGAPTTWRADVLAHPMQMVLREKNAN